MATPKPPQQGRRGAACTWPSRPVIQTACPWPGGDEALLEHRPSRIFVRLLAQETRVAPDETLFQRQRKDVRQELGRGGGGGAKSGPSGETKVWAGHWCVIGESLPPHLPLVRVEMAPQPRRREKTRRAPLVILLVRVVQAPTR